MKESKYWHRFILVLWRMGYVCLFLLFLATLLVIFPNPVLKPILLHSLNSRIPGTLEVEHLSWNLNHIHAKGIEYQGDKDALPLTLGELEADFTLDNDFWPIFEKIVLTDAHISAVYHDKSGFAVQGFPQMDSPTDEPMVLPDLPPIFLNKGTLRFETDYGPVDLILKGHISSEGMIYDMKGQAELSSAFLTLKGDLELKGALQNLQGQYQLHEFIIPQLFTLPIEGGGSFGTSPTELFFKGDFHNRALGLKFQTNTRHDFVKNSMHTQVNFVAPHLKKALRASTTKIPNLPDLSGGVKGEANFIYKEKKLTGGAKIQLQNISLTDAAYKAQNISGTIHLTNLEDFKTPPRQHLTIKRLDAILPLRNVQVEFQHLGGGKLIVYKTISQLEKGTLTTDRFQFTSLGDITSLTLHISGISAEYLAKFVKVSDIEVTGLVDGKLDLEVQMDDFGIKKGGKLWISNPPGIIKYRPDFSKALKHNITELTGQENPMDLALIALWNLHYNHLELDLKKSLHKELKATLHLKGKNPDAFAGHPFEFNINVSGETLRLIRETLKTIE